MILPDRFRWEETLLFFLQLIDVSKISKICDRARGWIVSRSMKVKKFRTGDRDNHISSVPLPFLFQFLPSFCNNVV